MGSPSRVASGSKTSAVNASPRGVVMGGSRVGSACRARGGARPREPRPCGWVGDVAVDPVSADPVVSLSLLLPGWRSEEEARALLEVAMGLPAGAVIVEVGVFMGRSTLLLAHSRRACGGGRVHAIDAFDGSGDEFSVPHYAELLAASGRPDLLSAFLAGMATYGVEPWVEVHEGEASEIGLAWREPVDLLMLDADQSVIGARRTYEAWAPALRPGGVLVLSNTADREYAADHDGYHRVGRESVVAPAYAEVRRVGGLTFARRTVLPG